MKIWMFVLLPLSVCCQQTNTYKNLALEGGGIRGIAYAGAFKIMEDNGTMAGIENIAGSSAGAIAGMMIAVGYQSPEIDSIMKLVQFQQFNDGGGGLIGKYKRVRKKFGMYKGDRFEVWLRKILKAKTGNDTLTFMQLHLLKLQNNLYKDLYCTGTNISRQRLEIFSYKTTPNLCVATAVRISGGIPLYFTPIALNDSLKPLTRGDTASYINYYVDGGMLCNYPISMFDSCTHGESPLLCTNLIFNPQTIGIKLERKEQIESFLQNSIEIPPYQPKKIGDYLTAFGNLITETLSRKYPGLENEKGRTIFVDYGNINPTRKKLSNETKQALYQNGASAATRFFNQHIPGTTK